MSKIFIVLLTLSSSVFAMEWRTWEAGLKEAKSSNKIIMIDVVRTGCHYCEDMEKAVFDDANMSAYIEKRFVPVKLNLSKEELPLGLHVSMTPTFLFISKHEKVLKKIPGSWNQEDFKSFLNGMHND